MKILVFVSFMMFGHAFADVPEIVANQVTCAQLKADVQNYGNAVIVKKILGFKKRFNVHHEKTCTDDETKEYGVFRTKDVKRCRVGEWCRYVPTYSGGYYDGGYSSGSDYSSGSSYDSGSSWDSGSSGSSGSSSGSYHGPSYNPPSSGSTGSNYNPPSEGTRGPRYCPGC